MKYILKLLILLIITGCSYVELKEVPEEKVPFKISKGEYNLEIYELNYPEKIYIKNNFYENLDIFVQKVFLNKDKYTLLISKEFYEDLEKIKNRKLIKGEEVLSIISSSLSREEKITLENLSQNKTYDFKDTTQGYLNRQVYILNRILDDTELKYDHEKKYTELDKEKLINTLKQRRKKMYGILERADLEFVLKIDSLFKKEEKEKISKKYYYKDVILEMEKQELNSEIQNYKLPIYVEEVNLKELENEDGSMIKIPNKYILINNGKIGYEYRDNTYYIFTGVKEKPNEKVYTYPEHKINIYVKKDMDLETLLKYDNEYNFTEIFGG
ncbi:MAG: hypothetical protein ACQERZ_01455 [Fusobacteriota bacterium]